MTGDHTKPDGKLKVPVSGKVYGEAEKACGKAAVEEGVLVGGRWELGFEKHLEKYIGAKEAILCNSGSSANLLAMSALTSSELGENFLRPGDRVITTAVGFPTTVAPIYQCGFVPIYVDIDFTLNIDPHLLGGTLKYKPRAMIVSHTLGNPFNLDIITRFCSDNYIFLIEDNCDALGSEWGHSKAGKKKTGAFGELATQSFYPAHHITTGEGGAVLANSSRLAKIVRSFRDWGRDCWCRPGRDDTCGKRFNWQLGNLPYGFDHKYIYREIGYNMKMTEMQAAIGFAQMSQIREFTERRQRNHAYLMAEIKAFEEYFILPKKYEQATPSWFGFAITVRRKAPFLRMAVIEYLESHGIATRMLFAGDLRAQPAFMDRALKPLIHYKVGSMINTDVVMASTFWIGCWHGLRKAHLDYIVSVLHDFVKDY